jgi:hypothetical protein
MHFYCLTINSYKTHTHRGRIVGGVIITAAYIYSIQYNTYLI